eukprot:scaffold109035_cov32-Tisochrysis_lutea.AAC.3
MYNAHWSCCTHRCPALGLTVRRLHVWAYALLALIATASEAQMPHAESQQRLWLTQACAASLALLLHRLDVLADLPIPSPLCVCPNHGFHDRGVVLALAVPRPARAHRTHCRLLDVSLTPSRGAACGLYDAVRASLVASSYCTSRRNSRVLPPR